MSKKEKSIELLNKAVNDESLTVHQNICIFISGVMIWDSICQTDRYPGDDAR